MDCDTEKLFPTKENQQFFGDVPDFRFEARDIKPSKSIRILRTGFRNQLLETNSVANHGPIQTLVRNLIAIE
jgi:hypothetical protein